MLGRDGLKIFPKGGTPEWGNYLKSGGVNTLFKLWIPGLNLSFCRSF